MFDIDRIRADFPIFANNSGKRPLIFMDSAASAQKPRLVIDGLKEFYEGSYANIHRGVYNLSQKSSSAYEEARRKIQKFINARSDAEIIMTKGGTEGINLVASSYGRTFLQEGDIVLITEAEHHANIVPWDFLRREKGIVIKVIPIKDDGTFDMQKFEELLSPKVKIVAVNHISNVTGIINPIKEITAKAHAISAKVLIDACQSIAHILVDVQDLDCDFLVFSSHKLYGPTGVGVLYAKEEVLEQMPPYQGGGGMVEKVSFDSISYAHAPAKFEAGTPAIAETVGLGYAIDYINSLDIKSMEAYENELTQYMIAAISEIKDLRVFGTGTPKTGIFSFEITDIHPHDIAMILDKEGIAVRSGTHCAEPVHHRLRAQYNSSTRASLGIYNAKEEIDAFIKSLDVVKSFFKKG